MLIIELGNSWVNARYETVQPRLKLGTSIGETALDIHGFWSIFEFFKLHNLELVLDPKMKLVKIGKIFGGFIVLL